jgi:polyadenylate-binding protein
MRKAFNNLYVKNFNPDWTEEELKTLFEKYGKIKSIFIKQAVRGEAEAPSKFAFVCYEDPDDKEAGPRSAMNAITNLHEKDIDGHVLYVRDALKKQDRDMEKKKEQLRFKNSKKRCNLYVKNFPPNTTDV